MDTIEQIPANVLAIIEQKEVVIQEQQKCEQEKKRIEEMDLTEKGKQIFGTWLTKTVQEFPEWLQPYLTINEITEPDYIDIARGSRRFENEYLIFSIPGLSEIQFSLSKKNWRAAISHEGYWYENEPCEPHFSYKESYWNADLESVLVCAKRQFVDYKEYLSEFDQKKLQYEALQAERAERSRKELDERDQLTTEREQEAEKERSEEQVLFDAIKHDPVMIHMLKALVLVHEERSSFEQRIQEADESAFWAEERQSRIAVQMEKQIQSVKRQADEERTRLQNDLDEAETKLKKVEKAQRGW